MNNMLQEIEKRVEKLVGFEEAPDNAIYYMRKDHIVWLLSQVKKAEQLQCELEEYKLENQSLKGTIDIIERKHRELVKRLAEANEEIERYKKELKEIAKYEKWLGNGMSDIRLRLIGEHAKDVLKGKIE
jgi:chromosome segregation ATPase